MSISKQRLQLKKLIVHNDVLAFADLMLVKEYRDLLTYNRADFCYFHEVCSLEMLYLLIKYHCDIRLKDANGKTVKYALKKRLKALLKDKSILKKTQPQSKKCISLQKKIKEQKEALQVINQLNKNIYLNAGTEEYVPGFGGLDHLIFSKFAIRCFFDEQDKKRKGFCKALANYLTKTCKATFEEQDPLAFFLNRGGYSKKKIHLAQRLLNGHAAKESYQQDEKGFPLVVYRGTTNKNDLFEPLSHFGTLKAAKERLDTLEELQEMPNSRFYHNICQGGWTPQFQIKTVYLKMQKPFRVPEFGDHNLKAYRKMVIHVLLQQKYGRFFINKLYAAAEKKNEKSNLVVQMPKEYDFIFSQPYELTPNLIKKELSLGGLYPVLSEKKDVSANRKNLENLIFQRVIRYFERQGYDGFVYKNGWEDIGNDSFIIFRKEQVVDISKADKKKLVSKVQNPQEKMLKKLEDRHFKTCVQKYVDLSKQFDFVNFLQEYGVGGSLVPQRVQKAFDKVCDFLSSKLLQRKFFSR